MKKKIDNRIFELREWQGEAERALINKLKSTVDDKNKFLCVATPGSGKTKFALKTCRDLIKDGYADRLVVVTPSENLKRQWAAEASAFAGLELDPDFRNANGIETNDYHGISITYALLSQDKNLVHQQNTFNYRTIVIFDEPHHMGDQLSWGDAAQKAFEGAVFKLLISGTPFRSDDAKIPFVKYDETNTSVADYTYSYERSIQDNVCRPVYFTIHDGRMKWKVDALEFEHTFKDALTPDQVSKRLKTALDPKGNFIRDVLRAADQKLLQIRGNGHPTAGGLIFAVTQAHAKQIAKVVEEITGEIPPVVISEDAEGSTKIEIFKHSNWRWLVSVKMVSEGIDIPRLRVGVYFTNIKAELFFRQAVGRFVRVQKELKEQEAYIFIPQDKDLVKLAETIQEERDHALDEVEKSAQSGTGTDVDLWGNDYTPALKGRFIPLSSESTASKTIAVAIELTSGAKHSVDHRRIESQNPMYVQVEEIKKRLNKHAVSYALRIRKSQNERPDFKALHKIYIQHGGKNMEVETLQELIQRESFYINQLRGIRN